MMPDFEYRGEGMYFDNAATTMIDPEVVVAMWPYLEERFGNPETVYELGREASEGVAKARHAVAEMLGCLDDEVFFTSGGTEANNWAIKGCIDAKDRGLLVSAVEHSSVLEPAAWMAGVHGGAKFCKTAPVDGTGMVRLDVLEQHLKDGGVGLVSVQYGNNEVGTIQPVVEISKLCRKHGTLFHCDAVQAFGKVLFDVDDVGCDMLSISAHKIHGPMGVGALYVRNGTLLEPLIHGGGQEHGMRSGTTAVHQVVGFGRAAELASESVPRDMPRISKMLDSLALDMESRVKATVNGSRESRLPHILSFTVPGMEVGLVCGIMSSKYGMYASSGAACRTLSRSSHVLEAMGRGKDASSTMRVSLSKWTEKKDMPLLVARLEAAIGESKRRSLV